MSKPSSPSIVILTGAGISAESALGAFRDKDGIWTKVNLEDVATPEGFARDPVMVHDFYNFRRQNLQNAEPNAAHRALALETPCPACSKPNYLRPHVVWFGEMPFDMERIDAALSACDIFLSIGTSGNVYPAAGYVACVRSQGRARSIELNLEPSEGSALFDECIHGSATEIVPAWVDQILEMSGTTAL